jgi:hypothetical protein
MLLDLMLGQWCVGASVRLTYTVTSCGHLSQTQTRLRFSIDAKG